MLNHLTAQRLIQTNQIRGCVALALHQLVFGTVERFLSDEHREKVKNSVGLELVGQVVGRLAACAVSNQNPVTLRFPRAGHQRIFEFVRRMAYGRRGGWWDNPTTHPSAYGAYPSQEGIVLGLATALQRIPSKRMIRHSRCVTSS